MTTSGPILSLDAGTPLAATLAGGNVATNQYDIPSRVLGPEGSDISFTRVFCEEILVSKSLTIGDTTTSDIADAVVDAGTAVQPGNGVAVNASSQVTTITTGSGIVIKSAATGAGVVLNSTGLFGCTDVTDPATTKTFAIQTSDGAAYFKGTITASAITGAGSIHVGTGGVVISSDAAGATPTTGIIISVSQIKLLSSSVAIMTVDGTTGVFTLQSAASGARMEITASAVTAYDSGGVARTIFDSTGLELRNASGASPTSAEEISFVGHSGVTLEGQFYYDHTNHRFFLANWPGGVLASWLRLDPTGLVFTSVGGSYLNITTTSIDAIAATDINLYAEGGITLDTVGGTSIYFQTDVNGADRVWFYDGRMSAGTAIAVPVMDYDIVAITTGGTSQADLAFTWTAGNHTAAPDVAVACSVNNAAAGGKYLNVGIKTTTSTGGTVDWMTVDGSTQNSATNIAIIGLWV